MKKPLSIRTYLGLSHALLLVISLGVIGYLWSRSEYRVISQEMQQNVVDRAFYFSNRISHEIEEHDLAWVEEGELPYISSTESLMAVYIDNSGTLIDLNPGSVSPKMADEFIRLNKEYPLAGQSYSTMVEEGFGGTNAYAVTPVVNAQNQVVGKVCVLMPIGKLGTYILRLRWMLVGAMLVLVIVSLGVSTLLTNYFSRHFSRAHEMATRVTEGSYHLRIPEEGPVELMDLAEHLNLMAEKLESQSKNRQTLLANVAHELARPLAGLQLGIESLRKGAMRDPELADDLLVSMGQTIQRLDSLIDDITLAALPTNRPVTLDCKALAVEPFLKGVATRYWSVAEERRIRLVVRVDANLPHIWADEKRLNQIIGNLMDNAIKFTPRGKKIYLSGESGDGGTVRLMVRDGGIGITPEESGHIFEPFYQGELGQHIKQGMGLGLSISLQLAQAHGGILELKNYPTGGAIAILTLKAVDL